MTIQGTPKNAALGRVGITDIIVAATTLLSLAPNIHSKDPMKDLVEGCVKSFRFGNARTLAACGATKTGYGTTETGCRGGSRYVEGGSKI